MANVKDPGRAQHDAPNGRTTTTMSDEELIAERLAELDPDEPILRIFRHRGEMNAFFNSLGRAEPATSPGGSRTRTLLVSCSWADTAAPG